MDSINENQNQNDINDSEIVDLTQSATTTTTAAVTTNDAQETINVKDQVETNTNSEIIAISDAEEESVPNVSQTTSKPKKRLSNSNDTHDTKIEKLLLGDIKRRKIKVAGAPKMPHTGYVRYMNSRRESLRKEQPDKSAIEHTRIIGEEWQHLTSENKAPYMEAAEKDKKRYDTELTAFLQANPEVYENELAKIKNAKTAQNESTNLANTQKEKSANNTKNKPAAAIPMVPPNNNKVDTNKNISPPTNNLPIPTMVEQPQNIEACIPAFQINPPPVHYNNNDTNLNTNLNNNNNNNSNNNVTITQGEIPIFTNEFLEHNKAFDIELRTLRKSKTDLEVQNAVLEKHVDNMKIGVKKLNDENSNLNQRNFLLKSYLSTMRQKLSKAFGDLAIPNEPNGANIENIDKYMADLANMTISNTHGPASLNKAKDILRKLDLQIQL